MIYLNTYVVHEAYGGPEEGGWWYDTGTPVSSIKISEENLDDLIAERDARLERISHYELKIVKIYQEADPGSALYPRAAQALDRLQAKKELIYATGRLAEIRKMAGDIHKAISSQNPIEPKFSKTGGYSFVVSSPDEEDPTPSAYYGNERYETMIEDHFAETFPRERPYYC